LLQSVLICHTGLRFSEPSLQAVLWRSTRHLTSILFASSNYLIYSALFGQQTDAPAWVGGVRLPGGPYPLGSGKVGDAGRGEDSAVLRPGLHCSFKLLSPWLDADSHSRTMRTDMDLCAD
jgi:hypothetical protein